MGYKTPSFFYQYFILIFITTSLVACGGGGGGGDKPASSEVTAAEYFSLVSNTVKSATLENGEHIVSFYNFEFVDGGDTDQLFQIGISKNNSQTYTLLVPDVKDVSTVIPDGLQAYPSSIIYSDESILLSVIYRVNSDSSTSRSGLFIIDRETLEFNFLPQNQQICNPVDGLQNADGSWIFVGTCDEKASTFSADANLDNIEILDQLASNSYGGRLASIIAASDNCLYAGGHNWEDINTQRATHIVIRKSCDGGVSWVSDLDYYNDGHAYTSLRRLYEFNGKIQFYGHIGEDPSEGTSTAVTVVTAQRDGVEDWNFTRLPGTTVFGSSPAYYIAFETGTCNMVSFELLTDFVSNFSLSEDCGLTWGDPVATDYGRMTGLQLDGGMITFYHYDNQFQVDKVNFSTAQTSFN